MRVAYFCGGPWHGRVQEATSAYIEVRFGTRPLTYDPNPAPYAFYQAQGHYEARRDSRGVLVTLSTGEYVFDYIGPAGHGWVEGKPYYQSPSNHAMNGAYDYQKGPRKMPVYAVKIVQTQEQVVYIDAQNSARAAELAEELADPNDWDVTDATVTVEKELPSEAHVPNGYGYWAAKEEDGEYSYRNLIQKQQQFAAASKMSPLLSMSVS